MNETSPANVVGYNIYRRQGGAFNKSTSNLCSSRVSLTATSSSGPSINT